MYGEDANPKQSTSTRTHHKISNKRMSPKFRVFHQHITGISDTRSFGTRRVLNAHVWLPSPLSSWAPMHAVNLTAAKTMTQSPSPLSVRSQAVASPSARPSVDARQACNQPPGAEISSQREDTHPYTRKILHSRQFRIQSPIRPFVSRNI